MVNNLGVSIYPEKSSENEIKVFLEKAWKAGFNNIFTNLLQITNGNLEVKTLNRIFSYAKDLGFYILADVNKKVFDLLKIKPNNLSKFTEMGINALRADTSLGVGIESQLTDNDENISIEINASGFNDLLEEIIKNGNINNLSASYNFYPQEYTGMSKEEVIKQSTKFLKHNIKLSAFISTELNSPAIGPWPTNDTIPTIEGHRYKKLSYQLRHYVALNIIDNVLLSTMFLTDEELKEIKNVNLEIPEFIIKLEKAISDEELKILNIKSVHTYRPDSPVYFLRSTWSRDKLEESIKPREYSKKYFEYGDVLILNDSFKEYSGEIQIVKKRIKNDGRRNFVGNISNDEMEIVTSLNKRAIFNFIVE